VKFKNNVFQKGMNLTVRKGTHWHNRKSNNFDIDHSEVIRFRDLKILSLDQTLMYEHDSKCRDYDGLLAEMKRVYKDFTANHVVTLVFFKELK